MSFNFIFQHTKHLKVILPNKFNFRYAKRFQFLVKSILPEQRKSDGSSCGYGGAQMVMMMNSIL
jgi:hypothetical protein